MERTLLEAAYSIETAKTPDAAWTKLVEALARLRIDNLIYITRNDDDPPEWSVRSTLPENWPRALANNPDFVEPFVATCCATFEPTKVGPEYLDLNDNIVDHRALEYIRTVSSFGWTAGLGIPTALKGSGRHGGFIVGNAMGRYDFERTVVPLVDDLRTLCLIANARFEAWRKGDSPQSVPRPLSPREVQVLELLSKGLRPKQIAEELGVKETSIRLYIKNAKSKLGASNTQDAVVLFLGRRAV